ncbi:MAG: endolytic transglycosylase MltG [Candidatus Paceibacterota bacterium]|jgi:UPF0755 protein
MDNETKPLSLRAKLGLTALVTGTSVFILLVVFTVFPPTDFPTNSFIHVDRGKTVSMIGGELKTKGIIRSVTAFKFFTVLLGGEKRLQVGTYFFKQPTSVINVALKLTNRFLGIKPYRVTIPEGMSNEKIANILVKAIPHFDKKDFLKKTEDLEGKLFPDTYFFAPLDNVDDIIFEMSKTWEEQTKDLRAEILFSGKSLNDILTMASIIERETRTAEDRRLVSGILWKRISIGMPLQVDATFEYYTKYNTYTITKAEMKKDSPYNTYTNKGLPPTPIANPGLDSIIAALKPTDSPYLYYLTGRDGKMYYAEDFAGHKKNRRLYLD